MIVLVHSVTLFDQMHYVSLTRLHSSQSHAYHIARMRLSRLWLGGSLRSTTAVGQMEIGHTFLNAQKQLAADQSVMSQAFNQTV